MIGADWVGDRDSAVLVKTLVMIIVLVYFSVFLVACSLRLVPV